MKLKYLGKEDTLIRVKRGAAKVEIKEGDIVDVADDLGESTVTAHRGLWTKAEEGAKSTVKNSLEVEGGLDENKIETAEIGNSKKRNAKK